MKICDAVLSQSPTLWACSDTNLGTEVTTPLSYPDGEAIVVYAFEKSGKFTLHDGGMAAYNLAKSGKSLGRKLTAKSADYARLYGCELREGRVYRACGAENVQLGILTVASVCQFIASHLPLDEQKKAEFEEKVIDVVRATVAAPSVEINPKLIGKTGHEYVATAAIKSREGNGILAIIDSVSSSRSVASKFRSFYDLKKNQSLSRADRIAVLEDFEGFPEGDIPLLQDVSNTVPLGNLPKRLETYAN